MKILLVTHYMPPHLGGIERVAASLAEGMRARGHVVRWISSAVPATHARRAGGEIRVSALNLLEEKVGVPYPLWAPSSVADVAAEAKWADVVHAHDCLYMGSAFAAAACRLTGTPLVLTQHVGYVPFGRVLDRVQEAAYRTLGRAVLSAASEHVACSPHVPAYFATLGYTKPFRLIRNGIDDAAFVSRSAAERAELREARGIDPARKVVLFSGRLVPKKGIVRVAALQRALAKEGVLLVVAGDGPEAHRLDGVSDVLRLGAVAPEEMPALYAAADAYVLPSRGEGLPLGVQEALLSGTSAVVSDDPAFLDGLAGLPGVRFASTDADFLEAVRATLRSGLSRDDVRRPAAERWGAKAFLDAYEAVYRGVLTQGGVDTER